MNVFQLMVKMEEKILYNVLKNMGTGKENTAAPDGNYLKSLENIGLITTGWDNELTEFGRQILDYLRNRIETY